MAQDQGQERTEPATPKRQQETRQRGRVPKSTDLVAAVTLLSAMVVLRFYGETVARKLVFAMQFFLGDAPVTLSVEQLESMWPMAGLALLETAAPLVAAVGLMALLVLYAQVGWLFTLKPLELRLGRLNPAAGFRRLLNLSSLVKLGMNLAKTVVVAWVAYTVLRGKLGLLVGIAALTPWQVLGLGAELVFQLAIRAGVALLLLSVLDFWYQRWRHNEDQKMTRQEVKEELRQMEGDPVVRRRQRNVQMQLAVQRIRSAVPGADVVVTNPTELAVALKYDAAIMSAPRVVAKGQGYLARRIREVAIEHGVPIVERKPLAQALYKTVEVGQEVPPQFYKAVAEILAYVYELSGRARRLRPAGAGA